MGKAWGHAPQHTKGCNAFGQGMSKTSAWPRCCIRAALLLLISQPWVTVQGTGFAADSSGHLTTFAVSQTKSSLHRHKHPTPATGESKTQLMHENRLKLENKLLCWRTSSTWRPNPAPSPHNCNMKMQRAGSHLARSQIYLFLRYFRRPMKRSGFM